MGVRKMETVRLGTGRSRWRKGHAARTLLETSKLDWQPPANYSTTRDTLCLRNQACRPAEPYGSCLGWFSYHQQFTHSAHTSSNHELRLQHRYGLHISLF